MESNVKIKKTLFYTFAKFSELTYQMKFQLNKLYGNYQHTRWNTAVIDWIDGDYYRNSANEAIKAANLPWESIHVEPHVTTIN